MRARLVLPVDCTILVPSHWRAGRAYAAGGFLVVPVTVPVHRGNLRGVVELLEYLTEVNREWVRKHPATPRLYQSGVTYQREDDGQNDYLCWPAMLAARRADCEDLASKRMQELRDGEDPGATFDVYWTGERLIHIRIRRAAPTADRREDPSRLVGM